MEPNILLIRGLRVAKVLSETDLKVFFFFLIILRYPNAGLGILWVEKFNICISSALKRKIFDEKKIFLEGKVKTFHVCHFER